MFYQYFNSYSYKNYAADDLDREIDALAGKCAYHESRHREQE